MRYINKGDVYMIALVPIIYILHSLFSIYNITVFNAYHINVFSFCYGGYIVIRLFTTVQTKMAIKKGLLSQLDDINRIEKKDKNDRPRWIK